MLYHHPADMPIQFFLVFTDNTGKAPLAGARLPECFQQTMIIGMVLTHKFVQVKIAFSMRKTAWFTIGLKAENDLSVYKRLQTAMLRL
jgi:hypothetical protein